ncbi:MAG: AraC family transcriptional regulator [Oscillospiraceae bacterium]|nr:AraC family transcriptional regulator [Oscillospiraceae bacterium]
MAIIEHSGYYDAPLSGISHRHTSCELMYVLEGKLEITVNDTVHHITENTLVLIKSRQHHKVRFIGNSEYHRFIAMINPWELRRQLVRPDLFAMLTDISDKGLIIAENVRDLRSEFERMTDIFSNGANIYAELSSALEIISVLYDEIKPKKEPTLKSSRRQLAQKVREHIEKNYADNLKITDIAEENFVSTGYLTHTFKAETGMSPREYLSHIRCTRAYELIKHTGMKFSAISSAAGFCCANDMSRKIREYYGLTPTEIRAGKT